MNSPIKQPVAVIHLALERAIDRYCERQKEHPDYVSWRGIRLHQEDYQESALETLRLLYGPQLSAFTILDVGSGMGGYPVALRRAGLACDGIEFNPDYVEISGLRADLYDLPRMVLHGQIEHLPYPDESYDLIHCHDVLEHCQDPQAGLREIFRVLKPGGTALVTFINRFAAKDPHYHIWGINWLPRTLGAPLAEWMFVKDISLYSDRQRLHEMHYFSVRKAYQAIHRAGFVGCDNVRRLKIEHVLKTRYPLCARRPFYFLLQMMTGMYVVYEYAVGQNYYWRLKK